MDAVRRDEAPLPAEAATETIEGQDAVVAALITVVDVASLERYDRTGSGLRSVTLPQAAARLAWRYP